MITYEQALEIAKKHFEQRGGMTVTKAMDIGDAYVFTAKLDDRISYGGGTISVSKGTGETSPFLCHVGDNFKRICDAIEMPL